MQCIPAVIATELTVYLPHVFPLLPVLAVVAVSQLPLSSGQTTTGEVVRVGTHTA